MRRLACVCLLTTFCSLNFFIAPMSARADTPVAIEEAIGTIGAATAGDPMGGAITAILNLMVKEGRIKVGDLKGNHGEFTIGPDGRGQITISKTLLGDPIRLVSTLIHEALHALDGYAPNSDDFPGMIQSIIDHINVYLEQVRLLLLIEQFLDDASATEYIECIIKEILEQRLAQLQEELRRWLERAKLNSLATSGEMRPVAPISGM